MMSGMEFDSLFDNAVARDSEGSREAGMDMFAVHRAHRKLEKHVDTSESRSLRGGSLTTGNGVRFCDDSILETQEPFMTQTYNDWDWQEWKSSTGAISAAAHGQFQYFMHKTEGGCAGLIERLAGHSRITTTVALRL